MSGFPLRYARRNILIGPGGEAAALYRADTTAYPFLPTSEKWALLCRLERFAHLAGADFSLWRVQRAYPAERYRRRARRASSTPRHGDPEGWRRYLEGHEDAAAPSSAPTSPRSTSPSRWPRPRAARARCAPSGGCAAGSRSWPASGRRAPISGAELEALAAAEQRTFDRLSGAIALQRASTARAAVAAAPRRLPRRRRAGARPSTGSPTRWSSSRPTARRAYEPLEHDLWRCANAPATEDPGEPPSLVVEAEEGTSFQAFLCAGSLAEEAEFPGAAELLFAPAEDAGFPVDAVLHARVGRQPRGARAGAQAHPRRRARLPRAARGRERSRRCWPRRTASSPASTRRSCSPPRTRRCCGPRSRSRSAPPTARSWSAGSARCASASATWRCTARAACSTRSSSTTCPSPAAASVPDYVQQMTVEQFGAMVPIASAQVGSPDGIYIGYCPGRRAARSATTRPRRRARRGPPAVLLAGTLGSRQDARRAGDRLRRPAPRLAGRRLRSQARPRPGGASPSWQGEVEVLELSGDPSHRGKLDPLRDRAARAARGAGLQLPAGAAARPAALLGGRDRPRRPRRGAGGRAEPALRDRAAARQRGRAPRREAGEALEVLSDFGLARLGFAPSGEAGLIEPASAR